MARTGVDSWTWKQEVPDYSSFNPAEYYNEVVENKQCCEESCAQKDE